MSKTRNRLTLQGIDRLFLNWLLSVGTLTLVVLMSLFVTKLWLPAVAIGMSYLIIGRVSAMNEDKLRVCNIMPYLTVRILLISAAIMVLINLYYMRFIDPQEYVTGRANKDIPYVTVLVLSPVATVVSIWGYVRRHKLSICRGCSHNAGTMAERGFLGTVISFETRYQQRMFIICAVFITATTWTYYFTNYCNVNFSHTDYYFYIGIPLGIFIFSVFYFINRYFKIYIFYRENVVGDALSSELTTIMRYIVVCDGYVFLRKTQIDGVEVCDTPASIRVPYRSQITQYDATTNFATVSGMNHNVTIKFLYENANSIADSNLFHYLCVVNSRSVVDDSRLSGQWYSQQQLEAMHARGELSSLLMSEIHRVYTIMMTRKTYNRYGYRLYDIKHYKPTFRLNEIESMDGDFNDPVWLLVARDNEDCPFFKFRQFLRRYVNGYSTPMR